MPESAREGAGLVLAEQPVGIFADLMSGEMVAAVEIRCPNGHVPRCPAAPRSCARSASTPPASPRGGASGTRPAGLSSHDTEVTQCPSPIFPVCGAGPHRSPYAFAARQWSAAAPRSPCSP